jgi:hypothetical protein
MSELKKLSLVLLALMAFGGIALACEWFKARVNGWLVLLVGSLVVLILVLGTYAARAHDHSRPALNDWLKSLHSANKSWCCNGDDADPIEDWETRDSHFRVKFRGEWYDVPEGAIVDGPNKGGDALLWMNKGYMGMSVRCFMPGTMG